MITAGGKAQLFRRLLQQGAGFPRGRRHLFQRAGGQLRVGAHALKPKRRVALLLAPARGGHSCGHLRRAFARRWQGEVANVHRRHGDAQVEAIQQRAGDAAHVILRAAIAPAAGMPRLEGQPAPARVHGSNELKARREGNPVIGPRDAHRAGFQRLAQHLQRARRELRQLVEKQHAIVRQRHLPRPGAPLPATGQRRLRGGVMRRAERAGVGDGAIGQHAGERGNDGGLQHLLRRHRRQDGGQARRQHGLAGSGRAGHQQVVATGGGDLQRALRALLPAHVAQVGQRAGARQICPLARPRQALMALRMVHQLHQGGGGDDVQRLPSPGGLAAVGRRADDAALVFQRLHRRRQHTGNGRDGPVQRQLAHADEAAREIRRQHAHGGEQRQGDGQVVVRTFLRQVGRREVDGNALCRQRQPGGGKRGADALAAFGHRLVRQADDGEGGHAAADVHLHIHQCGIYAVEGHRGGARDHEHLLPLLPAACTAA